MTIKVIANGLNFSERYVKKLKARYKKYGASSMMHGNCGKQPKHTISANIKSKIWEIWNIPELEECNFTHFQEILEEDYNIKISYTALSNFLKAKKVLKAQENIKAERHTIDVKKDLQQVNYYKLMAHLISFFMVILKNIACMVLLMMLLIK